MDTAKQSKKFKFSKIFTIILTLVVVCLSITMADLFSSLITVGGFTFTSNDLVLNKYTVYAICTSSSSSRAVADENASNTKTLGGAGYIFMQDSKFYVIASIYENETDAIKVKDSLKETNVSTEIITIYINPITISSNLADKEKSTLDSALNIYKKSYKELYDISVSLDTSVINEVNARLAVNQIASEITKTQTNFSTLFNSQISNDFLIVKLKLNELASAIDLLINCDTTKPYTSHIKECYCKIINLYKDLSDSLNKSI